MKHAIVILTLSFVFSVNAFAKTGPTSTCQHQKQGGRGQAPQVLAEQAANHVFGQNQKPNQDKAPGGTR